MSDIIKEMLSMVDFDSFKEAVKVTISDKAKAEQVKDEYVMMYLEKWAEAKKEFFEMFGHKLIIEIPVEFNPTEEIMRDNIMSLCKMFPQYAAAIHDIHINVFIENKLSNYSVERSVYRLLFPTKYKAGMKVTKALSTVINDNAFDIEISKFLQNRLVKGVARISIHPLDYVTISTNTHKWGSCMHIIEGFNKTGGYSLMMDKNTIITYYDTGKNVKYESCGSSFSWNNKIFRQLFVMSDTRNSFALGHYNGTPDSRVTKELSQKMCSFLDSDGDWKKSDSHGYCTKDGAFYYDTSYYGFYYNSKKTDGRENYHFGVKNLYCVKTGQEFGRIISYHDFLIM